MRQMALRGRKSMQCEGGVHGFTGFWFMLEEREDLLNL
jgi:hypothetical protein